MANDTASASLLIRRPPVDAFLAFTTQKITQFWLNRTTGPLSAGARVEWEFMVPGVKSGVTVTVFDPPRRLGWRWSDGRHVELTFEPHGAGAMRIAVTETGFTGDQAAAEIAATVEGYAIVLCDLKTLLESGESANLVRDKAALIAASLSK